MAHQIDEPVGFQIDMGRYAVFGGDLFSDDALRDSGDTFKVLRDLGDAVWVPSIGMFVVARYNDVVKALRASDVLISSQGVSVNAQMNGVGNPSNISTINTDGEIHRTLKRIEMTPLMPAKVQDLRARLEVEAEAVVRQHANGVEFDAMQRLAKCLPTRVVADQVGINGLGSEKMLEWAGAVFDAFGPAEHARTAAALPFILEFTSQGLRLTRDDVVPGGWASRMFDQVDDGKLDLDTARNLIFDYILPSLDTTIYSTAEMLYRLGSAPGAYDGLRRDPKLAAGVINEAVRLASPIRGFTRYVTEDFPLSETILPAGSRVWLLYASANRDERHYVDPDDFKIDRNPRDHLGWGHGVHLCSGIHLARLEMEVMIQSILKNVSVIEAGTPTRIVNNAGQGYETLPLTLHAK